MRAIKKFLKHFILYVCLFGLIVTTPMQAMNDNNTKFVCGLGFTVFGLYIFHRISHYAGLEYYLQHLFSSSSHQLTSSPIDSPKEPDKINFIDYEEWFKVTNSINQRQYGEKLNGEAFDNWVNGQGSWKEDHQEACQAIQKITQLPFDAIENIVTAYTSLCLNSGLMRGAEWIDGATPFSEDFFTRNEKSNYKFLPFIQGIKVSAESKLYLFGDRHGDVRSSMYMLKRLQQEGIMDSSDGFKINDKDSYLIFLGDYTDRGLAGIEVIVTILMLKLKNPDKVFLIRGNHEDSTFFMNEKQFGRELEYKYPDKFQRKQLKNTIMQGPLDEKGKKNLSLITKIYEFMAAALFVGCGNDTEINYILLSHANVDLRYNPKNLYEALGNRDINITMYERYPLQNSRGTYIDKGALATINIEEKDKQCPCFTNCAKIPKDTCFMNAYTIQDGSETVYEISKDQDSLFYGKPLVDKLLQDWSNITIHEPLLIKKLFGAKNHIAHTIDVFRGHQHFYQEEKIKTSPIMQALIKQNGVTSSWPNDNEETVSDRYPLSKTPTVYMIQQAPDNPCIPPSYGLTYDTCVEVTAQSPGKDWVLRKINVEVLS